MLKIFIPGTLIVPLTRELDWLRALRIWPKWAGWPTWYSLNLNRLDLQSKHVQICLDAQGLLEDGPMWCFVGHECSHVTCDVAKIMWLYFALKPSIPFTTSSSLFLTTIDAQAMGWPPITWPAVIYMGMPICVTQMLNRTVVICLACLCSGQRGLYSKCASTDDCTCTCMSKAHATYLLNKCTGLLGLVLTVVCSSAHQPHTPSTLWTNVPLPCGWLFIQFLTYVPGHRASRYGCVQYAHARCHPTMDVLLFAINN